jgi:hypothetical protein
MDAGAVLAVGLEKFKATLLDQLSADVADGNSLMIISHVVGDFVARGRFPRVAAGEGSNPALFALGEGESRIVSSLRDLLFKIFRNTAGDRIQELERSLLPLIAVAAAEVLAALAGGFRLKPGWVLRSGRLPPEAPSLEGAIEESRQLAVSVEKAVRIRLRELFPGPLAAGPIHLVVRSSEGGPIGVWVSNEWKEIARQPLPQIVDRLATLVGSVIGRTPHGLLERCHQARADIEATLLGLSPPLLLALLRAEEAGTPAGCLIASGEDRGVPVQLAAVVNLQEDPLQIWVVRPFSDFVLGEAKGGLFFFPGTQLVCRLVFEGAFWLVAYPFVRQARGDPVFVHPYVGSLNDEKISWNGGGAWGPAFPGFRRISPGAEALLPAKVEHRALPGSRDMCLDGQLATMRLLSKDLGTALRVLPAGEAQGEALARVVRQVWRHVRIGLTQGHVENKSYPRLRLGPKTMPYPIPDPARIPDSLVDRVYLYDPKQDPREVLGRAAGKAPVPAKAEGPVVRTRAS